MSQPLTRELWASIEGIYRAILEHPFIRGLTDGSLPQPAFQYYVVQDALYLQDYARSLALAGAKAPIDAWCEMFAEHAKTALVVERSLHDAFFHGWGLSPEAVYRTPKAPTNLAYTSYLLRVAYDRPFEEVVGAVLPCYWIYWEVGKHLERAGSPNPLYQRWIDTYSSEAFAAVVRQVLEVMDQVAEELPPGHRVRIQQHFIMTSRYEWMFWDAAYRQEQWPV